MGEKDTVTWVVALAMILLAVAAAILAIVAVAAGVEVLWIVAASCWAVSFLLGKLR